MREAQILKISKTMLLLKHGNCMSFWWPQKHSSSAVASGQGPGLLAFESRQHPSTDKRGAGGIPVCVRPSCVQNLQQEVRESCSPPTDCSFPKES